MYKLTSLMLFALLAAGCNALPNAYNLSGISPGSLSNPSIVSERAAEAPVFKVSTSEGYFSLLDIRDGKLYYAQQIELTLNTLGQIVASADPYIQFEPAITMPPGTRPGICANASVFAVKHEGETHAAEPTAQTNQPSVTELGKIYLARFSDTSQLVKAANGLMARATGIPEPETFIPTQLNSDLSCPG